jgi:integrase
VAKGLRYRKGAWEAQVTIHGQRFYERFKFANSDAGLRKAIAAYDAWISRLSHGEQRYDSAVPFGNIAQAYLDQSDLKPSTGQTYKQILNQYWMPVLATKPIYTIRPSHIREILAGRNVSQKTKRNSLIPLRGVFDLAIEEELIASNPVDAIRLKKHQKPPIMRFTPKEKESLLAKLDGDNLFFFTVAFETGMRTGEILGLKWEDITKDTITLTRAMVRRRITDLKTSKVRSVYISQRLHKILHNHPRRFAGGYVFRNQFDRPCLDADNFNNAWKKALKQCRMTYRRAYICRHTRASEMLMAGVEPAFAAKQLGHTTEMFLNTYADWISGVKDRDQVNLLNNI